MYLDDLDRAVSARATAWRAADAQWEIIRWPVTDKPAASLRLETVTALAELILWVSGEAEMIYARKAEGRPVSEHYEITTQLGLSDCLDDLESNIGL
jgi:hypothetical protein